MTVTNWSSIYSGSTRAGNEIETELVLKTMPVQRVNEDIMCVALGNDAKESESVLMWALHNSRGMRICVLHVHQPAPEITMMGEHVVKAHHEIERRNMQKTVDKYIRICDQAGFQAERLCLEMDSIEKGIVQLILEHGIKWLVMGAATNKHYSRKMEEPNSKKALYVLREAPNFCHIWFICKGHLIHAREPKIEIKSPPFLANQTAKAIETLRSPSGGKVVNDPKKFQNSAINYHIAESDFHGTQPLNDRKCNADCDTLSRSPSVGSRISTCSSNDVEDVAIAAVPVLKVNQMRTGLPIFHHKHEDLHQPSTRSTIIEHNVNDELCGRLEQFLAEAESSRNEAYDESARRKKAEKDVIDAFRKAKSSQMMYEKEFERRRKLEETFKRGKQEAEKMKFQLGETMEELRIAQEQKSSLESRIANTDKTVDDLEQKMFSAVELLKKFKIEKDELQARCDNAFIVGEVLRRKQADQASGSSVSRFFMDFSFSEVEEATGNFSEGLKIGEGDHKSIYRGSFRHTQVAVKVLHSSSLQGPLEFQHEVNMMSKLRHPNIITLIGACPESSTLVYEFLPNGSLDDRLACKNNTPPLSWKARLRIASDLCSALVFLHSRRPQPISHGNLKPSNILLDSNLVTKISDFVPHPTTLVDPAIPSSRRSRSQFFPDPEFLVKSDVYSFGIILLRLLTGRPELGIVEEVQGSLDEGRLDELLDPTGGDWPFVQAKQLAHVGVSCMDGDWKIRPEVVEVWRVLENMKASCSGFGCGERNRTPEYFVCPIFQEIMQDPVTAADGFTYESEALKGWLESHDTSPMTNVKLPHTDLLPNHALRSAIQEWLAKS